MTDNYAKYKGYYVRPNLNVDKEMINQCLSNYKDFDLTPDSVVMDWGMNIGGFGKMSLDKSIKKYIGVECHPENFKLCHMNLISYPNAHLINAAVTNENLESIELYSTNSKQNFCSGTINLKNEFAKRLRKNVITVPVINADSLIEDYQPTHLKCDIEGEEYRILDSWKWIIPECIKQIAIEYHWENEILTYAENRATILSQGFTPVYEDLNYVKGKDKTFMFLGEEINYRNIWGLDCLYKRN